MRFKEYLEPFIIIVFASYGIYLYANNDLDLYIHPRYILFTVAMSIVALLLAAVSIYKKSKHQHAEKSGKLVYLPLSIMLLGALILPARSLTVSTVSQRYDSRQIVRDRDGNNLNQLFTQSTKALSIVDWSRLIATNTDPAFYANKQASVSGFIFDANLGPDVLLLSRFVLTCCAVDVQPTGIPVLVEDWGSKYEEDDWLAIEGMFTERPINGSDQLVLVPDSLTVIDEPEDPYAN